MLNDIVDLENCGYIPRLEDNEEVYAPIFRFFFVTKKKKIMKESVRTVFLVMVVRVS